MAKLGTVVAITGTAFVQTADGQQKVLKLGDTVQIGDTIITAHGVTVELEVVNGKNVIIADDQVAKLTDEVGNIVQADIADSAIDQATINAVIKAIEEGRDINDVLEDTAAGLTGGSSTSYGFSFVNLLRIVEGFDPFNFQFENATGVSNDFQPFQEADDARFTQNAESNAAGILPYNADIVLSVSSASVNEGGSLVYTATVSKPVAGSDLSITLDNGQIILIPVGQSSANSAVVLVRADDVYIQGTSSLTVGITSTTGGSYTVLTTTSTVSTNVNDDLDNTTVSLTATGSVAEGGNIIYTASLTHPAGTAMTVTLSGGQTISIAAGASSGTVSVPAPSEDVYLDAGSVSKTITGTTGGNFENLITNPAAATTAITDTIDNTTVSLTATGSVAEGGNIIYTASLTHPAGTAMTVTLSGGQTISIAAGASSGTVSVPAPSEDVYLDAGSVSKTITGTTGGNFENLITNPAAATTAITDTIDNTTVSLTATGSVAEGGNIIYTASLTHPAGTAMTVTLSGGQTISIAAGASSGTVSVPAPSEDVYLDAGSVSKTITGTTGGNFENLITNPAAATTAITDTIDNTTVSLTATGSVAEGGNIIYTASLTHPAGTAMTVTLSGGQTISIAAGASSGTVSVPAPSEDVYLDAGSVSKTITGTTGGNFENLITNPAAATTAITDTIDNTTVSITGSSSVTEGATASYTVALTSPAQTTAVTVTLTYSGTAVNGSDFTGQTTVTIPAGSSSASFNIATIDDPLAEGAENFTVTVAAATGGNFENLVISSSNASVTTGIVDNDVATVSLSATPSITEAGGNIIYTATVTQAPVSALTVTLSNGSTITIPAGQFTGTTTVAVAASDDVYVDPSSVSATISGTSGGGITVAIDPGAATTAITDTIDNTTVSLTATGSVAEGGNIIYTASLTHPAGTAMTVTLSGGQTISIAAGASSGTVSVPAPSEDVYLDAGSVSKTITGTTGGNFENLITNPAAATTAITDTIDNTTVSLTATGSVAEGGNIIYTASLTHPAGTAMTVTLSGGQTISIAAGASSGTVSVPAPSEDVYLDAGSVSKTITGTTGGNFENLITNPAAATTAITDTIDNTTVSLTATGSVAEGGNIIYTASLTHPAGTAMTVTLSGGQTISIAAGASSGTVSVPAPSEDVYLDAGSVSKTITGTTGGNFENLITNPAAATTAITDTIDNTTVSITGSSSVTEGATASYTVALTSPAQTTAVTVTLTYSGTAVNGSDFTGQTTVTIPAGSSSASFNIATIDDPLAEGAENFTVTVAAATGGNFENLVISSSNASVTTGIVDNDVATVSLSATPSITEAGGNIIYTATVTQAPVSALTVTLSNGSTITIPAGQFTGTTTVAVAASDDVYVDPSSVSATISGTSGGGITVAIDPGAATTAITDTIDNTTVSLTATGSVAEGGNIIYTASLTHPAGTAMTVTLSGGQTISIAAGASSGTVSVPAPSEDVYLDAGSVSKTITGTTGGNFENLITNPAAATTAITDTIDNTTVSLTATGSVAEGGNIIYTASLTHPAGTAMTVTLSGGQTISIAAGASSGTVSVPAPSEDVYLDAGSVSKTITGTTGGNFENLITNPAAATTAITDTIDNTTVSLTATGSVAEGGNIIYTASLTHPAGTAMTVTLSGGQTISIAAGASSGTVSVPAPSEDVYLDAGSVSKTITGTTGGNFENLITNPAAATTAITDTIDNTTVSLTATGSVAEGGNIIYTASLTHPAGTAMTVTLSGGQTISIAAGASSGTVSVPAPSEDVYLDAGSVSKTITGTTGGNFENLITNPAAATTAITDTIDNTTVSLTATGSVAEGGNIIYTASLTHPAGTAMTVTLSGGQTISIAAGASSGTVSVPAPSEDVYLDAGSVSKTITGTTGGNFENLITNPAAATTAITDTIDNTTVSITGSSSVTEGATASYTVALTSPAQTTAVTVTLTYSGTAVNGSDFTGQTTVTIPAGSSSASFNIATIDDPLAEGAENFTVTVAAATGGNFENLVISSSNASVTTGIVDNDVATVSLSATPSITEAGGNIIYTATVTQAPVSALTVTLSNGSTITIPAGQFTGTTTVAVAASDDVYVDPSSVSATISGTSGGGITVAIDPGAATTAITDTIDNTTVSLTATGSVAEGGNIIYTASLTHPAGTAMTVTLSGGQTISIAAGASSGTVSVPAPSEDVYLDAGSVSKTITGTTGGNFENLITNPAAATTAITDTIDNTTVSLTATGSVAEGGNIIYTASLTHPAGTAMTVTLSGGQTISIAAGASSGTVSVPAPSEDVYLDAGSVSKTITGTTGGNFENLITNPAAATTAITDTIDNTTVSLTATGSVAEGGNIIYTASLTHPAGTAMTVTLSGGQTISIAAGASSGTVSVPAPSEDVYLDAGSVSKTITGTTGGNFENLITNPAAATTAITDTIDNTTVSLTATGSVAEGGNIIYTASLTHPAGTAMTVTLSGGQTISIAAGASSGTVSVPAPSEDVYLDAGSVSKTITGTTGGNFENLITNPAAATTAITDTIDNTTVSLTATGSVAEGGNIIYTASLTHPAGTAMTVTLSGGQTISIAAGASSGTVSVPAPSEDVYLDAGSVSKTITGTTGGNFENLITNPAAATTAITDTIDNTTVSLTATGSVAEGGNIIYTASLTHPAGTAMTVTLSGGQTISIAAGASSGTVSVPAPSEDVYLDAGSVSKTITGTTGGNFENLITNPAAATTAITDTIDNTTVTLSSTTAGTNISEGGSIIYTASVSNPVQGSALVVTLTNGQTITIPVGQSTASTTFNVRPDNIYTDANQALSVSISGTPTGGNYEAVSTTGTVTNTVVDDIDNTTVTLTASSGTVVEGGTVTYTATLSGAVTGSPLVITLNNGSTITIPVGQSSGTSAAVIVRADDVYAQGTTNVVRSISGTSGGNFEGLTTSSTVTTSVTEDSDVTTVTLSSTTAGTNISEGGSIIYTASVSNPVQGSALVVTLTNGQTITIPVGQSTASTTFNVRPDNIYTDANQALSVSISGTPTGGNYEAVSTTGTVTNTVVDDIDNTTVTLTASSGTVVEGGTVTYTATLSGAVTGSPLVITLNNGSTITIPVGQSSGTSAAVIVRADDVYAQGTTNVVRSISGTSGGNFEGLTTSSTVTTSVTEDSDVTTVTLSSTTAGTNISEGGSIIYTASVSNPVQGSALVVTLTNGQTITIPVGQSTASTTFNVRPDNIYTDANQALSVSISGTPTGGNYEAVSTTGTVTNTVVDDIDNTTVTLTASSGTVVEGGTVTYTATLSGAVTGSPLVITLNNGSTITIPVGQSSGTSAAVIVRADDVYAQGTTNVVRSISGTSGGNFEGLTTSSTVTTSVTEDSDVTTVTLSSTTAGTNISEGGSIIYTASVSNPVQGSALVVTLTNGQTITIPVGQSTASTTFNVRPDNIYTDANQALSVSISGTPTGGNYEAVSTTGTVTNTVVDDIDNTTVTLTASSGTVVEGGTVTYTATLSGAVTGSPLVITLNNGSTITIPVGQSSGTSAAVIVRADDVYAQGTTNVVRSISGTSGGNFEGLTTSSTVTTSVTEDSDPTTVTLTASAASVTEGGSIVYTATVNNAVTGSPLVVTLSNGQTITIPVGQTTANSAAFNVRADDAYIQGTQAVNVGISSTTGGNYEALTTTSTVSTNVTDDTDATTVSITGSSSVTEGATASYTVALTSPAQTTAVTVTLTYSGTAVNGSDFTGQTTVTIPAGSSSASFNIVTIDDPLAEGAENFKVTLASASGGNFESLILSGTSGSITTTIVDNDPVPTVTSITNPTVTEGTNLVFTVTMSNPSSTAITHPFTVGGTAIAGSDYGIVPTFTNGVTLSGTDLIVPAGVTSFTITIPTIDDALDEASETIVITAASGVTGTGTILDNDPTPSLSINDQPAINEAAGTATFTVTLSAASGQTVTVGYNTSNGTAIAGSDYTAATGTLTFAPGETTKTITVPITNDTTDEPNETFYVNLTGATNATISDNLGVGTIIDNDNAPTISSVSSIAATEGGNLVHTVILSNGSTVATTHSFALGGGTATSGIDYSATPTFSNGVTLSGGVLTVPAGVTSFTVTVPSIQDTIYEGVSENYNLTIGGIAGVGTITDNDPVPTISVSSFSVAEVDNLDAIFEVTLSNPSSAAVTVDLGFANGTATSGTSTSGTSSTDYGNDSRMYISTDGGVTWSARGTNTATFAAGSTSILVRTYINANTGGTELESETFTLTATKTAGTTANTSATGTATIVDDTVTVSSPTVTEGQNLVYGVTTSTHTSAISLSLNLSGTASPTDYGTMTFSNGVTYNSGTGMVNIPGGVTSFNVTLPTVNDTLNEPNETVLLNIGGVIGTGTINDNDPKPSISINDVTVNEGAGTATFTVTLSAASGQAVTVDYGTTSSTALVGADFTNASGTLSFAPGTTTQTITVNITNDNVYEGAESFKVNLSNATNATISDNLGIGTIMDNGTGAGGTDNDTPAFSVNNVTVSDQSSTFATFVVSLGNPSAVATSFSLALSNGTATGGGVDYGSATATNLQVSYDNGATWVNATTATIPANSTYVLVRTPITGDVAFEVSENFTLTVTRTGGVTSNTTVVATGTITDIDNSPHAVNDAPTTMLQEDNATTTLSGNAILGGSGDMADSDPNADTLSITGAIAGTGAVAGAVTIGSPLSVSGIYGTLTISANGSYTYTLDNSRIQTQNLINNQHATDVFTYKITDGNGGYDTATIAVTVVGTLDITAITPQPVLISADGLSGEYYGYNDTTISGNRVHLDDGKALKLLTTDANLQSVEDVEFIINSRNVAVGGPDNIVGTANAGATNAADVKFSVRSLDYGDDLAPDANGNLTRGVNGSLGSNQAQAAGTTLLPGDANPGSTTHSLANFLYSDASTAVVQTGAPTGAAGSTQTGLGTTTDAIIRMSGSVYLERGNYDFRVYADDGFRLKVGGETLLEYDGNQAPTVRTYNNVEVSDLISGLTSIELLYWEQGGNANLQFLFKLSSSDTWIPFSLDSIAFFSPGNAPILTDTRIQDIVETSVNQQYELRTGSVLDGDGNTNTLTGNEGRDYIQGFGGNDILNGFGGADFLDGGDGNDILNGGDGNDILIGGTGNDTMTGGLGDDIYRIDNANDVTIENAGEGTDTIEIAETYNPGTYTLAANFENVLLNGSFNTNVIGNSEDNRITGNTGDNTLVGLLGDDRLLGGAGNDTLTGDAAGLVGTAGGTAGKDIFEWNWADKGVAGAPAIDHITDFAYSAGKTDSIDLRDLLHGETSSEIDTGATPNIGNLLNFIDITSTGGSNPTTTIHISSTGGFTGGTYAAGAEDQRIVIDNVNLFTATGAGNETALLQALLKNGSLIVD